MKKWWEYLPLEVEDLRGGKVGQEIIIVDEPIGRDLVPKIKLKLGEAYPAFDISLRTKPLIGFRSWKLCFIIERDRLIPHLRSESVDYVWTRGIGRNNKPPVIYDGSVRFQIDRNFMGFYTRKTAKEVSTHGSAIIGVVSLFGRVIEHESGFRAQNIRIEELVTWELSKKFPVFSIIVSPFESDEGVVWAIDPKHLDPYYHHNKEYSIIRDRTIFVTSEDIRDGLSQTYDCPVKLFRTKEKAMSYLRYIEGEYVEKINRSE